MKDKGIIEVGESLHQDYGEAICSQGGHRQGRSPSHLEAHIRHRPLPRDEEHPHGAEGPRAFRSIYHDDLYHIVDDELERALKVFRNGD